MLRVCIANEWNRFSITDEGRKALAEQDQHNGN